MGSAGARSISSARAAGTRCRCGISGPTRSSGSTSARGCSSSLSVCRPRSARRRAGSGPTCSIRPTSSTGPPTSSTPVAGRSSGSRISTPGLPSSIGCSRPPGRLVLFEGHPIEWLFDVDEDGHWIATDYDYFAGPEASKGWAPEYIDRLSIPEPEQAWKFARSWTLGEVLTALAGAGLRFERIAEHPTDWWGGHDDVRPEERGRIPLSYSVVARRG